VARTVLQCAAWRWGNAIGIGGQRWVATTDLPTAVSHPFYARLNRLLADQGFDDFAETACAEFYADTMGRRGVPPGVDFWRCSSATSRAWTRNAVSRGGQPIR
jgi:hypothetical protein